MKTRTRKTAPVSVVVEPPATIEVHPMAKRSIDLLFTLSHTLNAVESLLDDAEKLGERPCRDPITLIQDSMAGVELVLLTFLCKPSFCSPAQRDVQE